MIAKILGIVIGLLILGAGLYYLSKEKDSAESRKIYGISSVVGAVVAVGSVVWMML